ncbi:MAG: DOMON-like domain-containing protein [Candidatus Binatia bacterium]
MTAQPLSYTAVLVCHPDTRIQAVGGITVQVRWLSRGALTLTYSLTGDCLRLRIPPSQPAARVDGLWQHTCFEVFLAVLGSQAYQEWNFSPSGEWATYNFRGYRDRLPEVEEASVPEIRVHQIGQRFELDTYVRLSQQLSTQPLRLALSAVIEDDAGMLSYWALKHPSGKPDFHHPEAFALEIAPLRGTVTRREDQ